MKQLREKKWKKVWNMFEILGHLPFGYLWWLLCLFIKAGNQLWRTGPPADSRAVVSYWRKNVHKYWLTAKRTKPAQEKYVYWPAQHDLNSVDWALKLQLTVCYILEPTKVATIFTLNIGTHVILTMVLLIWHPVSLSGSVCLCLSVPILGNPGVIHYVTLHSSPLGQLTDETSFSMNIHNIGEYLNS